MYKNINPGGPWRTDRTLTNGAGRKNEGQCEERCGEIISRYGWKVAAGRGEGKFVFFDT